MFKIPKIKIMAALASFAAFSTQSTAAVLTPEQTTALTDSVTAGYSEYIGLVVTVVAITIPATLIGGFLWRRVSGGGRS